MKRRDHWLSHWRLRVAELHRYENGNWCRKCGQNEWEGDVTDRCVCWKMRLPKQRKEK